MRTKKPIICMYCQKAFNHRHRLFRHMTDKHLVHCPPGSVIVTKEFLESFVEEDDCRFDHNHSCQEHGYFYLKPGEICPQQELKDILEGL